MAFSHMHANTNTHTHTLTHINENTEKAYEDIRLNTSERQIHILCIVVVLAVKGLDTLYNK